MTAIGFMKAFAGRVELRLKTQSIRAANRFKVGQQLQLYYGMRTKHCRKLVEIDPVVTAVTSVVIDNEFMSVAGRVLDWHDREDIALADGFPDWEAFEDFFREHHGLPLHAFLIQWGWP